MTDPSISLDYPNEQWRPIKGYEGLYEVSDYGRVRSLDRVVIMKNGVHHPKKGRIKSHNDNGLGYRILPLSKNGQSKVKLLHRLVAEAFLGDCPEGYVVNHKDGDKLNNMPENLEYITQQQNIIHSYDAGINTSQGETHKKAKLTRKDVVHILEALKDGISTKELAKQYGVTDGMIWHIKMGRSWKRVPRPMI